VLGCGGGRSNTVHSTVSHTISTVLKRLYQRLQLWIEQWGILREALFSFLQ
jgi:hypothetical protein